MDGSTSCRPRTLSHRLQVGEKASWNQGLRGVSLDRTLQAGANLFARTTFRTLSRRLKCRATSQCPGYGLILVRELVASFLSDQLLVGMVVRGTGVDAKLLVRLDLVAVEKEPMSLVATPAPKGRQSLLATSEASSPRGKWQMGSKAPR